MNHAHAACAFCAALLGLAALGRAAVFAAEPKAGQRT
jgi:hypothetical protein